MSGQVKKFRAPLIWCGVALIYILPFFALKGLGAAFIKFEGISGESTDDKHKDEIEVLSWDWGVKNAATVEGGQHSSGRVDFSNFTFTHEFDKASPVLALRCFKGEHIQDAIFTATRSIQGEATDYLRITFWDVLVTSLAHGGDGGSNQNPIESVGISYGKIRFDYTQFDEGGKSQGNTQAGWDLESNKQF